MADTTSAVCDAWHQGTRLNLTVAREGQNGVVVTSRNDTRHFDLDNPNQMRVSHDGWTTEDTVERTGRNDEWRTRYQSCTNALNAQGATWLTRAMQQVTHMFW